MGKQLTAPRHTSTQEVVYQEFSYDQENVDFLEGSIPAFLEDQEDDG